MGLRLISDKLINSSLRMRFEFTNEEDSVMVLEFSMPLRTSQEKLNASSLLDANAAGLDAIVSLSLVDIFADGRNRVSTPESNSTLVNLSNLYDEESIELELPSSLQGDSPL